MCLPVTLPVPVPSERGAKKVFVGISRLRVLRIEASLIYYSIEFGMLGLEVPVIPTRTGLVFLTTYFD